MHYRHPSYRGIVFHLPHLPVRIGFVHQELIRVVTRPRDRPGMCGRRSATGTNQPTSPVTICVCDHGKEHLKQSSQSQRAAHIRGRFLSFADGEGDSPDSNHWILGTPSTHTLSRTSTPRRLSIDATTRLPTLSTVMAQLTWVLTIIS